MESATAPAAIQTAVVNLDSDVMPRSKQAAFPVSEAVLPDDRHVRGVRRLTLVVFLTPEQRELAPQDVARFMARAT